MSVTYLYVVEGYNPSNYIPHRAACFGELLENETHSFSGIRGTKDIYHIRFGGSNRVTHIRVFPDISKTFSEEVVGWMQALVKERPIAFAPVTQINEKFIEISTDCPADLFWFCLNTLRLIFDPNYNFQNSFGPKLIGAIGVWRASILMFGCSFLQQLTGKPSFHGFHNSQYWTLLWCPALTNIEFAKTLHLTPEVLFNHYPPLEYHGSLYEPGGDDEGILVEVMQEKYRPKHFTFPDLLKELEISDVELDEMKSILSWS